MCKSGVLTWRRSNISDCSVPASQCIEHGRIWGTRCRHDTVHTAEAEQEKVRTSENWKIDLEYYKEIIRFYPMKF